MVQGLLSVLRAMAVVLVDVLLPSGHNLFLPRPGSTSICLYILLYIDTGQQRGCKGEMRSSY